MFIRLKVPILPVHFNESLADGSSHKKDGL